MRMQATCLSLYQPNAKRRVRLLPIVYALLVAAPMSACSNPQRSAPITERAMNTAPMTAATRAARTTPIDRNTQVATLGDHYGGVQIAPVNNAPSIAATPLTTPAPLTATPLPAPSNTAIPTPASNEAPLLLAAKKYESKAIEEPKPQAGVPESSAAVKEYGGVAWSWPMSGPVIEPFNETRNKGVDIAGRPGEGVYAAAAGRVVYAGNRMRGYGNLVIIKHNEQFISAYAHNRKILVKVDTMVRRGERIAELGNSDADRYKLHFEIRQQGKPTDPTKFLPTR